MSRPRSSIQPAMAVACRSRHAVGRARAEGGVETGWQAVQQRCRLATAGAAPARMAHLPAGLTPPELARAWSDRMPYEQATAMAGWMLDRGLLVAQEGAR